MTYARIAGFRRKQKADTTLTPQVKPIAGREEEMVQNAGGGYSFLADEWTRLKRFVILGVTGNTIYQSQKSLVMENAKTISDLIEKNPHVVVDTVVDILRAGRAYKMEPGLFVMALVMSYKADLKDPEKLIKGKANPAFAEQREKYDRCAEIRAYAFSKLKEVTPTPTQLFTLAAYLDDMRGWGKAMKKAFARWYEENPIDKLALHAWKYKSRTFGRKKDDHGRDVANSWAHGDIISLTHPRTDDPVRKAILDYLADKEKGSPLFKGLKGIAEMFPEEKPKRVRKTGSKSALLRKVKPKASLAVNAQWKELEQIAAAEELLHLEGKDSDTVAHAVKLIEDYRLTHEAVPGHLKQFPEVWEALADSMPVNAMIRNLGKMTQVGYISQFSEGEREIVKKLQNQDAILRSKAHPMRFLLAQKQYQLGHGDKGSLMWSPSQKVVDALDGAFYAAFGNVVPTGRRILIAVDDSGSMRATSTVPGLTVAQAAAAMALVTMKTEPNAHMISFAGSYRDLPVGTKITMDGLLKLFGHGEYTDTSLPIRYLLDKNLKVDAVVSYTDNNTYAGNGHVSEYLARYSRKVGYEVRMINCAMEANHSTDVDAKNPNMVDLVGLDTDTPSMISGFIGGEF